MMNDLIDIYLANAPRCECCNAILSSARVAELKARDAGTLSCVACDDVDEEEDDE